MNPSIKKTAGVLSILFILVAFSGLFFYQKLVRFSRTPLDPSASEQIFVVQSGQSFHSIAENLGAQHLISDPFLFKLYGRYKKAEKKLQAGEYALSAAQSPERILTDLTSGRVKLYRLTVPEGFSIRDIAVLAEKHGFCPAEEFEIACRDRTAIAALGIDAPTLEGYLFPETYHFPKDASCKTIIAAMIDRFKTVFSKTWQDRAEAMGFSRHEVVTLASIIEKETGDPAERPLISSVFHNRLKKKMRLESDPTVIYGIADFDGNLTRKHLETTTPYNTYRIKGLPPGPIANPGKKSLEAALYPAKSDFLFFVSKKDTTHYFSRTITEHNRAVRKYQLGKK